MFACFKSSTSMIIVCFLGYIGCPTKKRLIKSRKLVLTFITFSRTALNLRIVNRSRGQRGQLGRGPVSYIIPKRFWGLLFLSMRVTMVGYCLQTEKSFTLLALLILWPIMEPRRSLNTLWSLWGMVIQLSPAFHLSITVNVSFNSWRASSSLLLTR